VVADGQLVEACRGDGRLVAEVTVTADGFLLEPFQLESNRVSYVARLGKGCTPETLATFQERSFAGLAVDPNGAVWAADLVRSELVRLDLEHMDVVESFSIPVDHRLLDIDGAGTFYLAYFNENVLRISRDGMPLDPLPSPASFLVAAPNGTVWISAFGALTEYSEEGVALRSIADMSAGPFAVEGSDILWTLSDEQEPETFLFSRITVDGELLGVIRIPRDHLYGAVFLSFVPSRPQITESPSLTPTTPPTRAATALPTKSATATATSHPVTLPPPSQTQQPSPTRTPTPAKNALTSSGCVARTSQPDGPSGSARLLVAILVVGLIARRNRCAKRRKTPSSDTPTKRSKCPKPAALRGLPVLLFAGRGTQDG
jgi:hypothetical protein